MAATVSSPYFSVQANALLTSAGYSTQIIHQITAALTVGSSSGNVNKVYSGVTTIASSGSPASLDLTSLTDQQANAITFADIVVMFIQNLDASNTITPGGGSNPILANAHEPIPAGGAMVYFFNTDKTVDSSHKVLKLTSSGGSNILCAVTIFGH